MLGASAPRAFREVTWPLLRPAVISAASIVFLFTVTSFGVVLLLGGPRDTTLEVEIYRQTAILLDLPTAAALTLLQMVGVTVLLLASARAQEGLAVQQRLRASAETARPPRRGRERAIVATILAATIAFMFVPLAVLVERSLATPEGYGLAAYASLLEAAPRMRLTAAPWQAVLDSLRFAAATTLIAGSLGLLTAAVVGYRRGWLARGLDTLVMLPLGTSAVIVGFGFLVSLDTPPLDLRTSILLIPIAHSLIALPFVMRAVVPLIRSIDDRLREAAAVLGASPRRAWREVDAPILARGALVGAGFAFAVSLGEFGATLFIARPDTVTIPVAIYRLLGQPGAANFATAMALAVVLMVMTATAVLLIERLRGGGPQPF
jgi:thiamine transport system permease protein